MKHALAILLFVVTVSAGELSDAFWREELVRSKARREAIEKGVLNSTVVLKAMQVPVLQNVVVTNGNRAEYVQGSTEHGISEIGIERSVCLGTCPAYVFIVSSDGNCRYEGGKHAKIAGKKTGRVSLNEFHRLARFAVETKFFELDDQYHAMVTDQASVFTSVVAGGKRKIVCNYAQSGPSRLWAMEELIDAMLGRVKWD